MADVVLRGAGGEYCVPPPCWAGLISLAIDYGWRPSPASVCARAEAVCEVVLDRVTDADARSLADALERVLDDMPDDCVLLCQAHQLVLGLAFLSARWSWGSMPHSTRRRPQASAFLCRAMRQPTRLLPTSRAPSRLTTNSRQSPCSSSLDSSLPRASTSSSSDSRHWARQKPRCSGMAGPLE
jgi:hypothetical protein